VTRSTLRASALATALAACALWQSCGDVAAARAPQGAGPGNGASGGDGLHHPLDLTDDLYHRIRAGLFVPECEPLLIRSTDHAEGAEPTVALAGVWYRFDGHMGSFELETSASGAIVVHANREALLSHLTITSPRFHHSMTREFLQYPSHPMR
jgi:hypothetical protein